MDDAAATLAQQHALAAYAASIQAHSSGAPFAQLSALQQHQQHLYHTESAALEIQPLMMATPYHVEGTTSAHGDVLHMFRPPQRFSELSLEQLRRTQQRFAQDRDWEQVSL